ncbi:MAG TPA: DEAD/DEAH box helicase [Polyangiaceae bacterium]|nr:DEAD/DEAH box helicase [Polyangiaceae bacterium]
MKTADLREALGPDLSEALEGKGYEALTPVQVAVLQPELENRDLRISSQTGSGKTVAIGIVLRSYLSKSAPVRGRSMPTALVVTPTRELAKQVQDELTWLYAPRGVRVAAVTGGANYRDEHRSLAGNPGVVVGTPGRLLDHLRRGSIEAEAIKAIVLDEADRMLDLGFREDIDAILAFAPEGRRTHLVSATFSREVLSLADSAQQDAMHVQGTPLGTANQDIEHLVHVVQPRDRLNALVNLLLAEPGSQTLVFARTRADVADLSDELRAAGFSVGSLSGEMEQTQRNRALSAFKRGELRVLVATDVAARGIDVRDVSRVVQMDPPPDPESYTHRSGRTGRAGRKGTSSLVITPSALGKTRMLLQRARVKFRFMPVPTAADLRRQQEEHLFNELVAEPAEGDTGPSELVRSLAKRLLESDKAELALARLLESSERGARVTPRELTPVDVNVEKTRRRGERPLPFAGKPERFAKPPRGLSVGPLAAEMPPRRVARDRQGPGFEPFRVSYGENHGADARRLLAMLCRRGGIESADIGAIRVMPTFSLVEIAAEVAGHFERSASMPDPRDRHVRIERDGGAPNYSRGPVRPEFKGRPRKQFAADN